MKIPADERINEVHDTAEPPAIVNLRQISDHELSTVLMAHKHWIETGGAEGGRATLPAVNLEGRSFVNANLKGADLAGANLQRANLRNANLIQSNLKEADLTGADLREALLQQSDLRGAWLTQADMRDSDLRQADLRNVKGLLPRQLGGADVSSALLSEALITSAGLSNVAEASKVASTVFVSILVGCVYVWLTVGATTDSQLVVNSASFALPIIGTKISLVGFYAIAPLILFAMYIYFHLNVQRIWDVMANLPAVFQDGTKLNEVAYPWLLNGLVSAHFKLLRGSRPPLSRLQGSISMIVGWWLVPTTIILAWGRYLVRHDWFVTSVQILLAGSSVGLAAALQSLARRTLRRIESRSRVKRYAILIVLNIAFLFALSFLSYKAIHDSAISASMMDEEVSVKPPSWTGKETELVRGPNLFMVDLRKARLDRDFLVNAYLRGADLQGAALFGADIRGADLIDANLSGAFIINADLRGADLTGVRLDRAYFDKSDLRYTKIGGFDGDISNWKQVKSLEGANVYGVTGFGRFDEKKEDFLKWAVNDMNAFCVESDKKWHDFVVMYLDIPFEERATQIAKTGRLQPGPKQIVCISENVDFP